LIDIYCNKYFINNKKCNIVTIWIMILIIFFLIFLNIAINFEYKKYDKNIGYIKKIDENFKVVLYLKDVSEIYKYSLLVENIKYDFSIYSISNDYYIIDNQNYYEVVLNTKLKEELLIENNIIEVVFEKYTTTLYKELKKGMIKWLS